MSDTVGFQILRLGRNALIHVLAAALGWVGLSIINDDNGILRAPILSSLNDKPQELAFYVDQGWDRVQAQWVISCAISLLVSCLWLFFANRVKPAGNKQAASHAPTWWLLLLGGVLLQVANFWRGFHWQPGAQALSPERLIEISEVILILVLVTYYLGTALAVKSAMRPSVPLANLWLR